MQNLARDRPSGTRGLGAVSGVPGSRQRITVALALGLIATLAYWLAVRAHIPHSDWTQIYEAAQALRNGQDPYAVVRHDQYPFYYPVTAAVLALPFTFFPSEIAQSLWGGLGTAAFAYALTRRGWWPLLALAGMPYLNAFAIGQWSLLMAGASALPWLGAAWAAKPTIGAAFFAAWPSRRAIAGMGVLLGVSLLLAPGWLPHWLSTITVAPHIRAPVLRPGGVLLLLGLVRWRRPEGRLLAALALVPQTSMAYEMVALFLIPRTIRQMGLLVAASQIGWVIAWRALPIDPSHDLAGMIDRQWPVWFVCLYLPSLVFVLWQDNQWSNRRELAPQLTPVGTMSGT
jgi:hypothetical protein